MSRQRLSSLHPVLKRTGLLIFLAIWLAYGAAINSNNLTAFDLQQIGVEALAARHHFYLEGSPDPQMQTKGDVFEYNGHLYAAKQPGQFMSGAIVYSALRVAGLSYASNYLLTSALVTFFTTSLVLALSVVAFFRLAQLIGRGSREPFWTVLATFAYAFGTTMFAYSGIPHHDALASGYLVIAFYLTRKISSVTASERNKKVMATVAGLLLGLTITTSMLPFFMSVVCAIYFFTLRRWRLMPLFVVGLVAGLVPLFIYDAASFGSPFRLANVAGAGMFADTFWHFDPRNFGNKVAGYSKAVVFYAPVVAAGLFGWSYYPLERKRRPEFRTIALMTIVLVIYVFNISSDGDCQFGPRYLLPLMPFACLGVVGYGYLSAQYERGFAAVVLVTIVLTSCFINLVGALGGAMNCLHGSGAFTNRIRQLAGGEFPGYPLAKWLLLPLIVCVALLILGWADQRRNSGLTAT